MHHYTAHAHGDLLLFTCWDEARVLWEMLAPAVVGALAICLMPDHLHVAHPEDRSREIRRVMAPYARRINHRHGRTGRAWNRLHVECRSNAPRKARQLERYILLNPCRAGLVSDPLAWPFSSHLDALGLTLAPACRRRADPAGFHRYVSSDRSVDLHGTELPAVRYRPRDLEEIAAAVSTATRTPLADLQRRTRARQLFVGAGRAYGFPAPEIAAFAQVSRPSVYLPPLPGRDTLEVLERMFGDPRLPGLAPGDLTRLPAWRRYLGDRRHRSHRADHGVLTGTFG